MLRTEDPSNPIPVKAPQVQQVGSVKKTLAKIVVNMNPNPEEQYKSKVEFFLRYGSQISTRGLQMNFGIRTLSINPELSDLANINKWFDVVDKLKITMSSYAQRILECYDTTTSRQLAKEYIEYAYTVSCRTLLFGDVTTGSKTYTATVGDTDYTYYDTDPFADNNMDLEATRVDMTDKLYNFVSALFNKLAQHIEIYGDVEGWMFNGWGKEYKDKKTELIVQSINQVMTPDSFLLPVKSKINDKIYYNSNYDSQFVFQNQQHVTENEVGVMQGLLENPDKYQKKCSIAMLSNVELNIDNNVVSEKEAANTSDEIPKTSDNVDPDSLPF